MREIYLNASDVAAACEKNFHKSREDVYESYTKDPEELEAKPFITNEPSTAIKIAEKFGTHADRVITENITKDIESSMVEHQKLAKSVTQTADPKKVVDRLGTADDKHRAENITKDIESSTVEHQKLANSVAEKADPQKVVDSLGTSHDKYEILKEKDPIKKKELTDELIQSTDPQKVVDSLGTADDKVTSENIMKNIESTTVEHQKLAKSVAEKADPQKVVDSLGTADDKVTSENIMKNMESSTIKQGALTKKIIENNLIPAIETECPKQSNIEEQKIIEEVSAIAPEISNKEITSHVNKTKGINAEPKIIEKLEEEQSTTIKHRNSKLYTTHIAGVKIGGRIDGIDECTGELVEVKKRRNGFRGFPIEEKIQCEVYLRLTGLESGVHIQEFNGKTRRREFKRDPEIYKLIEEGLKNYVDFFREKERLRRTTLQTM